MRAAALPLEVYEQLGAGGKSAAAVGAGVRAWAMQPAIQEALRMASTELASLVQNNAIKGEGRERLESTLLRYLARMSGRATPYGLFASLAVGRVDRHTQLRMADVTESRRGVQLDALVCFELARRWQEAPEVREHLRFYPTPYLAWLGERVRCVPMHLSQDTALSVIDLQRTPTLDAVLTASRPGRTLAELVGVVGSVAPRTSEAKRRKYLEQLVTQGVLFSELLPASTGPSLLKQLEEITRNVPPLSSAHRTLCTLREHLQALEASAPGQALDHYEPVQQILRTGELKVNCPHLLHVDLWRPLSEGTLGANVTREMLAVAQAVERLSSQHSAPLEAFTRRFMERYDTHFVPFSEALDEEYGLGFSSGAFAEDAPLLDGIRKAQESKPESWTPLERTLLRRLLDAVARGDEEIELTESDLGEPLKVSEGGAGQLTDGVPSQKRGSLPATFAVFTSLAAASDKAADEGDFWLLMPVVDPFPERLMGRFCRLSPQLEACVRQLLAAEPEPSPDEVVADLTDLPLERFANVTIRPPMRDYEIVLRGRSGSEQEHQIHIDDLLLGIHQGRLVLVSRRLGKRVRVRPVNAINYEHRKTLPIHQFLGRLSEHDGEVKGTIDWGALGKAPFLPRLRYRRAILQPACWNLSDAEFEELKQGTVSAARERLQTLRVKRRMPRWVSVGIADHVLPIDLDNPVAAATLIEELRSRRRPIKEFLPALFPRAVSGPEGTFVHELIVPFSTPPRATVGDAQKTFVLERAPLKTPGSDVLYAKLHGPADLLEELLLEELTPLLDEHRAYVQKWFFVRYQDGRGNHLRLRVFGEPSSLWSTFLPALLAVSTRAVSQGKLFSVQLDSYEPESERYGGLQGVALAERLFSIDSRACVELLRLSSEPNDRWRLVALGLEAMLHDFGLDRQARLLFYKRGTDGFVREFGGQPDLLRGLSDQARTLRVDLQKSLSVEAEPWTQARAILAQRSQLLQPVIADLYANERQGTLLRRVREDLLWSFCHLFCNRMIAQSERVQEMGLYSLLERQTRSDLARKT